MVKKRARAGGPRPPSRDRRRKGWVLYCRDGADGMAVRVNMYEDESAARSACRWANRHMAPGTPGRLYWVEWKNTQDRLDPECGLSTGEEVK